MASTIAIEVEGTVEVVERSLPTDMSAAARETAKARKTQDVLIVLERDKSLLESALATRAAPLLTSEGALPAGAKVPTPQVTLTFADGGHGFGVSLHHVGAENRAMSKQVRAQFASAVREELLAHVSRKASSAGIWDVAVAAEPRRAVRQSAGGGESYMGVWLSLLALFAAAAGGAYYFLTPH